VSPTTILVVDRFERKECLMHILLVEDDLTDAKLFTAVLRGSGH
jgi:hypothetical protein